MVIDIKKLKRQQYYKAHAEQICAAARAYRTANIEAVRKKDSRKHLANRDRRIAQMKALRDADPAANREACRRWKANNPDKAKANEKKQRQKKMANPDYVIGLRLRTRLYLAVKKSWRSGSAVRHLGLPVADFRDHVASQFQSGMDWETWGNSFELDHIYPLAAANLQDPIEFRAVVNWRNYQPLTPEENREKGDSITDAARERFEVLANFLEVM